MRVKRQAAGLAVIWWGTLGLEAELFFDLLTPSGRLINRLDCYIFQCIRVLGYLFNRFNFCLRFDNVDFGYFELHTVCLLSFPSIVTEQVVSISPAHFRGSGGWPDADAMSIAD